MQKDIADKFLQQFENVNNEKNEYKFFQQDDIIFHTACTLRPYYITLFGTE
jgi:hypothetical protein